MRPLPGLLWQRLLGRRPVGPSGLDRSSAAFRLKYERFREILALNDGVLQVFAEIEDRLASRSPVAVGPVVQRVRKAAMDVFVMVKNLNQIAGGRWPDLYDALQEIAGTLDGEFLCHRGGGGRSVLPVSELRAASASLAGVKMANLGEVESACLLEVPAGFVVTTGAFARFMEDNGLWERAERLEGLLETHGEAAVREACAEVQAAIRQAPLPEDVARDLLDAFDAWIGEGAAAVRSSALGEDSGTSSHAGIYLTLLDVARDGVIDAWREVVASTFSPVAVSYRFARGLTASESAMAVGCLRMLAPRTSGIMFSRAPEEPTADRVVISATAGVAAAVAAGTAGAEHWVGPRTGPFSGAGVLLDEKELRRLAAAGRLLEAHFGGPQDVEWAIEPDGRVVILQTRPLVTARVQAVASPAAAGIEPLLAGGACAFAGVASGPVVPVATDADLQDFPTGGILVARHSSTAFVRAMGRCAAIVTEVGSPTGHMAILARELHVPSVVGLAGASEALHAGAEVTVDAGAGCVFLGRLPAAGVVPAPAPDPPAVAALRRIARLSTPLRLTDPGSPTFAPEHCASLHDVTRFVHEKVFEVMFHFGDEAACDRLNSFRLDAGLPLQIRVFDVGDGLDAPCAGGPVGPGAVRSAPMRAFLAGMTDSRVHWRDPRPVSVRGFLSVLGESMAGPPAEAQQVGRLSYAIVSDRYMNFSTKAGYHFSTVDTYCGGSPSKNYIHFRFSGGAADEVRRRRRVLCISKILVGLEFRVEVRSDLLAARLDKYGHEVTAERLEDLGRLTMCARQLDMLMDSDLAPDHFASAFLNGDWGAFF